MEIIAEPLTPEAFAPFGDVIDYPAAPGRTFFNDALGNARPHAKFDLSLARVEPLGILPLRATSMERHEFSSQTFLPLAVSRCLVVVAPHAPGGGPDTRHARAFIATARQGFTYRMNTWHHGLTVLDAPGEFAVLMWCDGGPGDQEFVQLAEPFSVKVP
jgi:ureidoglycolate lyase